MSALGAVPRATRLVILCADEQHARGAFNEVQRWLQVQGLRLHPDKTHVGDCRRWGEGFEFFGYRFEAGRRWMQKKSLTSLMDKIRRKAKRPRGASLEQIIADLNPILRGWFAYFKHAHRCVFLALDGFVRRRLRAILRRREKRPGRHGHSRAEHRRWPNAFFAPRGLFTLTEAHALAS